MSRATDFALNRYHELPSTLSNLRCTQLARFAADHGFEQITPGTGENPIP
jgi:oxygen-independent coproporphyrinogen-3 oxidase